MQYLDNLNYKVIYRFLPVCYSSSDGPLVVEYGTPGQVKPEQVSPRNHDILEYIMLVELGNKDANLVLPLNQNVPKCCCCHLVHSMDYKKRRKKIE